MVSQQGGGGSVRPPAVVAPRAKKPVTAGVHGITAVPAGSKGGGVSRPQSSSGGGFGGFSGGGGGGGLGSNSSGQISTPAPKAPSLSQFLLGDSTYLAQKSALDKARADYLAQQGQSKTQYLTNYARDASSLKDNRTQALGDLENDFASRGLLQSGLYADNMANLNKEYDTKSSALDQARAAFLAQLASDFSNFSSEQNLTLTRAQQEAAARRGTQYGV